MPARQGVRRSSKSRPNAETQPGAAVAALVDFQASSIENLAGALRQIGSDPAFDFDGDELPSKQKLEELVGELWRSGTTARGDRKLPPFNSTYGLVLLSLLACPRRASTGSCGEAADRSAWVAECFSSSEFGLSKAGRFIANLHYQAVRQ
jgi:hypothetical protein